MVGSPIANRQEAQLEELIGFFVNSLVMRVRVKPEMSFRELLAAVRRTALEPIGIRTSRSSGWSRSCRRSAV